MSKLCSRCGLHKVKELVPPFYTACTCLEPEKPKVDPLIEQYKEASEYWQKKWNEQLNVTKEETEKKVFWCTAFFCNVIAFLLLQISKLLD